MQSPKVSVVIPSYNHGRYLTQRMDSIFAQTYRDLETIVLDDASTDDSRLKLLPYYGWLRGRVVVNAVNGGSAFPQWNRGIALAKGEYVWIAESDDAADPRFLETLVPLLDENPGVGLAYCASKLIDADGRPVGDSFGHTSDLDPERWNAAYINSGIDEIRRFLVRKNTIPNASAVLVRRSVLVRTLPIDSSFKLCGDWLHWAKVLLRSNVAYVPELLNFWRLETSNSRPLTPGLLEWREGQRIIRYLAESLGYDDNDTAQLLLNFAGRCIDWFAGAVGESARDAPGSSKLRDLISAEIGEKKQEVSNG
jgi:glycosyltransferase involved in cell wall biosynthesis